MMPAKGIAVPGAATHAAPEDFCAIFSEDMNRLYLMALLLTGDQGRAEECFIAALDDCRQRHDIFSEWARTWSRRAIVKQAMRLTPPVQNPRRIDAVTGVTEEADPVKRVMRLPSMERFVFVMSVLERYSIHECAVLLNCGLADVERARARALRMAASHALMTTHESTAGVSRAMALRAS